MKQLRCNSTNDVNFVLEFNLSKDISDNQELIKLPVSYANIPTDKTKESIIGYKHISSISINGEIHCIESYRHIKEKLYLLDKLARAFCDKPLMQPIGNLCVNAKLYGYRDDELVISYSLHKLYLISLPINIEDYVDFRFGFVDIKINDNSEKVHL